MLELLIPLAFAAGTPTLRVDDHRQILEPLFRGTKAKVESDGGKRFFVVTRLREAKIEGEESKAYACGRAEVRVVAEVPVESGESYVVTATECESLKAHAYGALIGLVKMKRGAKEWMKVGEYKLRTEFGSWGEWRGEPTVVKLAPRVSGLSFEGASTGQGYTEGAARFFALEGDGKLRHVGTVNETLSNDGTECGERCFQKTLAVTVTSRVANGWFEIEARVKGTEEAGGKPVPVDRVRVFRYEGVGYVERK